MRAGSWRPDIDRRKVSEKTIRDIGWEVLCLLEDLANTGVREGIVEMKVADGLPETTFAVRVL